jgi:cytochrome c-type biogenesis protein
MRPVVDRLRQAYSGNVDVKVIDLSGGDADAERLAALFGVEYVPTFAFVDSDGTRRGEIVGGTTESELRARLDALK